MTFGHAAALFLGGVLPSRARLCFGRRSQFSATAQRIGRPQGSGGALAAQG